MSFRIFKIDTNLTDVDTANSIIRAFTKGVDSVDVYFPGSAFFFTISPIVFCLLLLFTVVKIVAVLGKAVNKENIKPKETRITVLALVGTIAMLIIPMSITKGPEGEFGKESIIAYYDNDKATVKDIQGSWLYKNHDLVQQNIKSSSYLKGYDIRCEDEMKIPEQEKRSVLCGGDVLSPVVAKDKDFNFDYWLLADLNAYKYHGWADNPRIAKLKKQNKDEENPITVSMVVEKRRI